VLPCHTENGCLREREHLKRPSSKGATYIKKKWVDQAVAAAAYGDQMQSYIKKLGPPAPILLTKR